MNRPWIRLVLIFLFLAGRSVDAAVTAKGLDKNSYTTDFMIGNVVVSVIFPESNGTQDPNIETWSPARQAQVMAQIMAGHEWWTQQNTRSPLSFTYVSQTVTTKYEPITRPYYDEALWIPEIMAKLGYNGSRFTSARNYANALRTQHNADWAFTIFVVDSNVDANGKFTDGLFAYAYLGGPFMVMTYDNNGYGISNMGVVAAHETGHIFNALDQYAGASGPNDYSTGYFRTINGNHAYSSIANEPNSIMRGGIRWGLDKWAKESIGWRDSNNNGRDDIMDQPPTSSLSQTSGQSGTSNFSGQAAIAFLPRQGNAQGYGLTLDNVSKVEYLLANGGWGTAVPSDGAFDSTQENFDISVPANSLAGQAVQASDVQLRITTTFSTLTGGVTSSSGDGTNLNFAHAYPNPFKPNSGLGHTNVTFTDLTPGAKVQIFSVAGEPVFDKEAVGSATEIIWEGVNDDGKDVASGVYYYLITNTSGQKKDGKIGVIR